MHTLFIFSSYVVF